MKDNGQEWVWVVAASVTAGDIAFQVQAQQLGASKLPDEFDAQRVTFIRPTKEGQVQITQWFPCHAGMAPQPVRMRGSSILWWAKAKRELADHCEDIWSPKKIKRATPAETNRLRALRENE